MWSLYFLSLVCLGAPTSGVTRHEGWVVMAWIGRGETGGHGRTDGLADEGSPDDGDDLGEWKSVRMKLIRRNRLKGFMWVCVCVCEYINTNTPSSRGWSGWSGCGNPWGSMATISPGTDPHHFRRLLSKRLPFTIRHSPPGNWGNAFSKKKKNLNSEFTLNWTVIFPCTFSYRSK